MMEGAAALERGTIEVEHLTKIYGGSVALSDFSHRFSAGHVHALMGKNGSGKSTLVKILAGAVTPTSGSIRIGGKTETFASPRDAFNAGIVTVHQELSLVPELSVAENIFLGRLPYRSFGPGLRGLDWRRLHRDAAALLEDMGLDIDPRLPARDLSVGRQQVVEIVKAMSFSPSVLLLDEPTSALAAKEVSQLFAAVRRLRERGVTMVYITHRLPELFEIADTCTVLRDGQKVGSIEMREATTDAIVEMMFGSVARARRPARRRSEATEPVLEVENLTRAGAFEDISLTLKRGEVLGLAGMLGAGRTEVLRAIFGADAADSGRIVFDGKPIARPTPRRMKDRGLGYTPENRKEAGLVQVLSVHDNLCMASLARIAPSGVITETRERPYVGRQIGDLSIKVSDPKLAVSSLSGGNQQKIVIGKWLNTGPKVMFFDEPSRGIDVEAKQQVFEIIWAEAARGVSSIFVSVELEEMLEVCDRILVLHHGHLVGEVRPEETSLTELYRMCMEGTI
jgi:ABC-type sugar transport system ATPase subunit